MHIGPIVVERLLAQTTAQQAGARRVGVDAQARPALVGDREAERLRLHHLGPVGRQDLGDLVLGAGPRELLGEPGQPPVEVAFGEGLIG